MTYVKFGDGQLPYFLFILLNQQTTSILKGGKHMAYRKKFVNEKKIMYGLRIPNLYVKNMHHME